MRKVPTKQKLAVNRQCFARYMIKNKQIYIAKDIYNLVAKYTIEIRAFIELAILEKIKSLKNK